jgi:pyruvate formate lyase activating enzyme
MSPGLKKCSLPFTPPDFPVKGFIETSFIDWKSHLASVVFSGGCNFRCPFCHNGDLVLRPGSMQDVPFEHILGRLQKFRKWINRVVVTGGEPTIHKGLPGALEVLKGRGVHVKLDTNGSRPEVVKALVGAGLVDYIAMDMKGPLASYDRWCGCSVDKGKIRESIDFILEGRVDYEFRMTLVPFLHREQDALQAATELGPARRFFLQEFVPRETLNEKYASVQPFPPERMSAIREKVAGILQNAPFRRSIRE